MNQGLAFLLLLFIGIPLSVESQITSRNNNLIWANKLAYEACLDAKNEALDSSLEKYQKSLQILIATYGGNFLPVLKVKERISECYLKLGNRKKAQQILKEVLTVYKKKYSRQKTLISTTLGKLHFITGRIDSAFLYYKQSLKLKQKIKSSTPLGIANSYNNIALCFGYKKLYDSSIYYYRKSVAMYSKDDFRKARTLNNIGNMYTIKKDTVRALQFYQKALVNNVPSFKDSLDFQSNPSLSVNILDKITFFESLYRKVHLLLPNKSLSTILTADSLAKSIRKNLLIKYSDKINFLQKSGRLFELALAKIYKLYFKATKDKRSLTNLFFYFSERSKANVLLDQIAQDNQEQIISLPETQQKLQRRGLAILSYIFAQGTLYVSVISGKKTQIFPLLQNITRQNLRYITNKLQGNIQSLDIMDYLEQATKAYNKLLATPIKQLSPSTTKVLLIPTPELSGIPWEGLPMQPVASSIPPMKAIEVANYVIRKYDVYHHFNISLALKTQIRNTYSKTYLGLGINNFFGKLPKLKQSALEVIGVAKLLTSKGIAKDQVDVYTNKAATKSKLSSKYKIIHLSTHGQYKQRNKSQFTELYLIDQSQSTLETFTTQDIYQNKDFGAELVILSGCQSRKGKIAQYEGIIGFERALIQKGVKFILSSSWESYDEPSRELFSLFFKYIDTQKWDYNTAWMKAKREFIKKPQLPGTWAGLVLIGLLDNG